MIAGASSSYSLDSATPNCAAMPSLCISCTSTTTLWHKSFANASFVSAVVVLRRRRVAEILLHHSERILDVQPLVVLGQVLWPVYFGVVVQLLVRDRRQPRSGS